MSKKNLGKYLWRLMQLFGWWYPFLFL
jgi:hypothetical protein